MCDYFLLNHIIQDKCSGILPGMNIGLCFADTAENCLINMNTLLISRVCCLDRPLVFSYKSTSVDLALPEDLLRVSSSCVVQ